MSFQFENGQKVFLKTDPRQEEHIIVARRQFIGGTETYTIGHNGNYFDMYAHELSSERDQLKAMNIPTNDDNCWSQR
jgi:hypothetical protein